MTALTRFFDVHPFIARFINSIVILFLLPYGSVFIYSGFRLSSLFDCKEDLPILGVGVILLIISDLSNMLQYIETNLNLRFKPTERVMGIDISLLGLLLWLFTFLVPVIVLALFMSFGRIKALASNYEYSCEYNMLIIVNLLCVTLFVFFGFMSVKMKKELCAYPTP